MLQVVVVLSGSMEPGFYRGDILFLNMGQQPIRVGEVVVFNIDERDIPIVHRVIKVHETQPGGEVSILTKVHVVTERTPVPLLLHLLLSQKHVPDSDDARTESGQLLGSNVVPGLSM